MDDEPTPGRAVRRDATRNRAAILDAAERLTREAGTTAAVGVADVARAAGVATGTVYRHWADKQDLLEAVLLRRLDEVAADAESASSLAEFLDRVTGVCVRDHSLLELLDSSTGAGRGAVHARLDRAVRRLIDRAGERGELRNAVEPGDIRIHLAAIRAALRSDDPGAWRRHQAVHRAGLFRSGPDDPVASGRP